MRTPDDEHDDARLTGEQRKDAARRLAFMLGSWLGGASNGSFVPGEPLPLLQADARPIRHGLPPHLVDWEHPAPE